MGDNLGTLIFTAFVNLSWNEKKSFWTVLCSFFINKLHFKYLFIKIVF